ncbi:hypothetical protein KYLE_42 [Pantoea phage Kyle]|uniref:Uncharacterized protein n=1 Tax=Pantoea phage Kyle TaxID=2589665 RepID=A0A514A8L1_9CAUD|nr:tail fiber protein [Pantoea phage Kyle]QDH49589.1 hypothetical protein KYLE_42 [Pantoea phage Kyle]
MINVSGYGLVGRLIANRTYPQGVNIADFADDADPADAPDVTISDTGVGLNGDLVVWNRASALEVGVNVIPTSQSDVDLHVLAQANRVGKRKTSAKDVITLVLNYPSGMVVTLTKGTIISGSMIPAVAQQGRIKTRQYRFRFENVVVTGISNQEIL